MVITKEPERLTELLVQQGELTPAQAEKLKKNLRMAGGKGRTGRKNAPHPVTGIATLGLTSAASGKPLDEEAIMKAVAKAYNLPYKKLDPLDLDAAVVTGTVSRPFAMKNLALPILKANGRVTVAVADPETGEALDKIKMVTGAEIDRVISSPTEIENTIVQFFSFSQTIEKAEKEAVGTGPDIGNLEQLSQIKSEAEASNSERNIQAAVDSLLRDALKMRSSDIHIEPKRDDTLVRNRIDGVLMDTHRIPRVVHNAVLSRIKLLARMDISEKRKPQDGRIKVKDNEKEVEMRVSVMPVAFGEKAVIRIFDFTMAYRDLDDLGFYGDELARYKTFLSKPHGIILVTGPTGSGKTSTLYSSLKYLSTSEKNIVTIEDPIEMVIPEFNQVGVQAAVGLDFAGALRAILRQDPDVIMLGEIRDRETARNAVQAALTGHLVISTLHTNDTVSSLTRLFDLGVEPYLVKTSLIGILSQRLVRVIHNDCRRPFTYTRESLKAIGIETDKDIPGYMGEGCDKCRLTGFHGRIGIHEILEVNEEIRELVVSNASEPEIRRQARRNGMRTIQENALRALKDGKTTLEEILKFQANLF